MNCVCNGVGQRNICFFMLLRLMIIEISDENICRKLAFLFVDYTNIAFLLPNTIKSELDIHRNEHTHQNYILAVQSTVYVYFDVCCYYDSHLKIKHARTTSTVAALASTTSTIHILIDGNKNEDREPTQPLRLIEIVYCVSVCLCVCLLF